VRVGAVANAIDARSDSPRTEEPLHVLEQATASAAEADVAGGLAACLNAGGASVRAKQAAQKRGLHLDRRGEDRRGDSLRMRTRGGNADALEQVADSLAACAKLNGAVRHRLSRNATHELGEESVVGVEQAVVDV